MKPSSCPVTVLCIGTFSPALYVWLHERGRGRKTLGLFGKLFGGGEAQGEAVAVIRAALETIMTPQGAPLAASRALSEILVQDGAVTFSLTVPPAEADLWFPVRDAAEKAVRSVRGVKSATVVLAAEHAAGSAPKARPQSAPLAATPAAGARPAGPQALAGVAAVVAVASGKGGVGKSTTAANLAVAAAQMGLKVGLLDADIYGPSVPRLFGVSGPPEIVKGKKTVPPEAHGIKVMSMGLLVKEETPVAWRGPMVVSALSQMIGEIEWAPLDLLLIDMPPGTGDIQLSLAQRVALTGAVIVST
ncbi:MAG: P-loop NTPase, partial [Hyphomicrobiaceae bacterium]|nr:P-loop NTPase [Hyphomicrobiaceae bacterium]